MTRPNDHDAALEAELAGFVPVAPSADLRRRVAAALAGPPAASRSRGLWLAERVLWACAGAAGGALAASLALTPTPTALPAPIETTASVAGGVPPGEVAEEEVTWADAGVQFLDDRTPARILRRIAVERHRPAGGAEFRVPREDFVVMPVALR